MKNSVAAVEQGQRFTQQIGVRTVGLPPRRRTAAVLAASRTRCSRWRWHASAIACGYKNAFDLDWLWQNPLMRVAVGRCPDCGAPPASQSSADLRMRRAEGRRRGLRGALLDQAGTTVKPRKQESMRRGLAEGLLTALPRSTEGWNSAIVFHYPIAQGKHAGRLDAASNPSIHNP